MTDYIIPGLLLALSALALGQRKNYYDWLLEGAAQGLGLIKTILPSLVLLLTAVHMFRASGASELLSHLLSPVFSRFGTAQEPVHTRSVGSVCTQPAASLNPGMRAAGSRSYNANRRIKIAHSRRRRGSQRSRQTAPRGGYSGFWKYPLPQNTR